MKIHPLGAKMFHADAPTRKEREGHVVAATLFSQLCERALKKERQMSQNPKEKAGLLSSICLFEVYHTSCTTKTNKHKF
jgi:hypothetical protein